MVDELEAIKKLDEAIQALKGVGYEFAEISIANTDVIGNSTNTSRRKICIMCSKNFPIIKNEEIKELLKLSSFST